ASRVPCDLLGRGKRCANEGIQAEAPAGSEADPANGGLGRMNRLGEGAGGAMAAEGEAALPYRPMSAAKSSRPVLRPIGVIRSTLKERKNAPRQGGEGAPDAWLEVRPWAASALQRIAAGDRIIVITWLHQGRRDVFQVYPRGDRRHGLFGVFATRSPD